MACGLVHWSSPVSGSVLDFTSLWSTFRFLWTYFEPAIRWSSSTAPVSELPTSTSKVFKIRWQWTSFRIELYKIFHLLHHYNAEYNFPRKGPQLQGEGIQSSNLLFVKCMKLKDISTVPTWIHQYVTRKDTPVIPSILGAPSMENLPHISWTPFHHENSRSAPVYLWQVHS